MAKANKMGRPPIPAAERRSVRLALRITKAERLALEAEAKRQGISVGELLMKPYREGK